MDNNNRYSVPMIERSFEIMNYMYNSNKSLGVTEISKKLEIPKATVFRILYTLRKWSFIEKHSDNDKYLLGKAFIKYASKVKAGMDIVTIGSEYIDLLAEKVGESANLGILYEDFILTTYNSRGEDFYLVSNLIPISPLNCSGMGKLYLAEFSTEELKKYFNSDKPESRTVNSITEIDKFLKEKKDIISTGISYDKEEYEYGLSCIAAPITNSENKLVAAISISGPSSRLNYKGIEFLEKNLLEIQNKIMESLKKY